jgi:GNAT superfamily N-acetyltransferase
MDVRVRKALDEDWPAIWPLFSAIVAAGETYAYPTALTPAEGAALWMEAPPGETVVAERAGRVVGSAKMGPNRPGRGAHVATASFMVDPGSQGQGVGRLLGDYVVEWARGQGYRGMQFNAVVESNESAVRLWKSLGFEVIGTVPEAFDHPHLGFVGLHVMYRRL